jgi:hypothetical protein
MAATKYTFSIANDTANGIVNVDALGNEIAASAIVTAFDYPNTAGDVLDLWFKDPLSAGDQTVLAGVVSAHAGAATEKGVLHEGTAAQAALNTSTDIDKTFPNFRYLSGASAKIKNQTFLDTISFEVWHPQGTEPIAVYGDELPVPHDGLVDWGTIASEEEGRADIPAGIILRAKYTSVATAGPLPEVCLFYRTHLG